MATATEISRQAAIEYPDSDGLPMADNTLQYEWIVTIKGGLDAIFLDNPNVFVAGDLLWYPVRGKPTIRSAPDVMIAIGRPKGYRGSYKQWEEGDLPPQVVFEILSPGNRPREMIRKFGFYQEHGVQEYYIYDPEHGPLDGWLRTGDRLEEIPEMSGFMSPLLGIRFEPGEGPDCLKMFGPDGSRFLTFTEWVEKAKAVEQRAEAERLRADAERLRADAADHLAEAAAQRADAADQRAERLVAKLRELGLDDE
jgi:Uma2 family endonuclease